MQKCLSNKQETKKKVLKENKELKKEMISINSQLQYKKYEITKKVKENNNLKEEKPKRELEKQNATLRTINLEVETKLHSSNIYLNSKNSNNGHQTVKTKEIQNIIEKL